MGMTFETAEKDIADLDRACAGESSALERLIDRLTPIIQARAARTLVRRWPSLHGARLRQETEDLVQDVMVALFAQDAAVLRAWDPAKGLSLDNYVGMVAERHVFGILQSRVKTWPAEFRQPEDLDGPSRQRSPEQRVSARQIFDRMLELLERELRPQGFDMFKLLFVEELTVPETRRRTGLTDDAIYAWRSRLRRKIKILMRRLDTTSASQRSTRGADHD